MKDNELDDFFRKGLEEPEVPFVQEDWEKMKGKLAGIEGGTAPNWFQNYKMLLIIAGALFLGLGAWFVSDYRSVQTEGVVDNTQLNISGQNAAKDGVLGQKEDPNGEKEIGAFTEKKEQQADGSQPANEAEFYKRNRGAQLIAKANSKSETDRENAAMLALVNGKANKRLKEWIVPPSKREIKNLGGFSERFEGDLLDLKKEQVLGKASQVEKNKPQFHNGKRWSTTALLSPDVSALQLNDIQGLGTSVGLNVEYFIHPKWSINLGALYAFKTYGANEGYQLPGYGNRSAGVKGDCYIIDVPLNLRFYAINGDLDRWYISSGLSSYLMLREKYSLEYGANQGYPTTYSELDVRNQNRHYLQVINISMGYERVLSEKISLQVEPYFKLPLSGVGEGRVSLKSAGALIGLKYSW
ncbi:hypothetical protein GCM10028791_38370 [Echinicola sediminis]